MVECVWCAVSIQRESVKGHLKSTRHEKATLAHQRQEEERRLVDAEANRHEEAIREVEYANLRSDAEMPQAVAQGGRDDRIGDAPDQSAEEEMLWDDFLQNGADFTMNTAFEEEEQNERVRMNEKLNMFGVWDPERAGLDLGFQSGIEVTPGTNEELLGINATSKEDAFLADLFENTGVVLPGMVCG